jgi:hypothetical protein
VKEAILHLDDRGHPIDLHCDGQPDRPVSAFLLLANVPADPPGAVLLSYGNSDTVGRLLMTLYERSVHDHPEMAWMLEQVSRGIIGLAEAARSGWPAATTEKVM